MRASVVDAMSMNLRTIVATDAVGDRAQAAHEANLFDMGQKYAGHAGLSIRPGSAPHVGLAFHTNARAKLSHLGTAGRIDDAN